MENGATGVSRGSVAVEQLEADIRALRARRDYHERELQSFRSEIIYFERLLKEKKKQSRWAEGKDGKIQAKAKKKPSKKAITGVSAEHVGLHRHTLLAAQQTSLLQEAQVILEQSGSKDVTAAASVDQDAELLAELGLNPQSSDEAAADTKVTASLDLLQKELDVTAGSVGATAAANVGGAGPSSSAPSSKRPKVPKFNSQAEADTFYGLNQEDDLLGEDSQVSLAPGGAGGNKSKKRGSANPRSAGSKAAKK
eukprot:g19609.t1